MTSPPAYYTEDQAQQLIAAAVAEALAQHQASAAESAQGTVSMDQVQGLIASALAEQAEAHNTQLQQLMAGLRGSVVTYIPEHAGGPGTEVHETWSQYEQEQARAAANVARAAA